MISLPLETILVAAFVLAGRPQWWTGTFLQLQFPLDTVIQTAGGILLSVAFVLIFWSLHAIEPGTLARRGPYGLVRHPMYAGYFLAVAGFLLFTLNLAALLPLLMIPAQVRQASIEEAFLLGRFGHE